MIAAWRGESAGCTFQATVQEDVMAAFLKIIRDNRGVGAIEYALIASLISVAAIAAFETLGEKVGDKYEQVDSEI